MADASTSVYEFDNMVRGQHAYKSAWTLLTDKTRKCILREDNKRDAHIKRDIENKLIFHNVWHYFNIY